MPGCQKSEGRNSLLPWGLGGFCIGGLCIWLDRRHITHWINYWHAGLIVCLLLIVRAA